MEMFVRGAEHPVIAEACRVSIRVLCPCGHHFRVKDKYAGKQGKCPGCGEMVHVPDEAATVAIAPAAKGPQRSGPSERRQLARMLARALAPQPLPQTPWGETAAASRPAREPGHDFCELLQLHDGSWAAVVATVRAEGVHAVTSALELRAATRALAFGYSDPGAILSLLNRAFVSAWPEDRSATMLLGRWDPPTRTLSYASAAHPPAFVLDTQGSTKWTLESTDCPLGLLAHTMYGTSSPLRMEPGETLMIYSDGLRKANSSDGTPLGMQKLLHAAGGAIRQPARVIAESLLQLLPQGHATTADATVLVIKAR